MEQLLFRFNPWWEEEHFTGGLIEREKTRKLLTQQLDNKQVVFITGLRRIGKSSLMKLLISYLIEKKGVDKRHVLYVSLDNYLLAKNNILEIVEQFMKIQKIKFGEKLYLFFDEITHKADFEIQLKNLYDSYNAKIFASSSSAGLMKKRKELLTGRHTTFELMPLDFEEYLHFKHITLKKADSHLVPAYFHEFLKTGGLPEFVLNNDINYLNELVDSIIRKDIAAVHHIKNTGVLKDYFLLLMERSGKQVSINKVSNILNISPDTARRYFDLFCDTYLIYPLIRYGKTNEKLLSPRKIYAADLGIRTLFTGERDFGSLFENYVFLKIKHLGPYYFYDSGIEMDFFTPEKQLLEVKYHDKALSARQQALFDKTNAKYKQIIRNSADIEHFLQQQI